MDLLRTTEFRVGLLATVVLVLLAVMVTQVSEDPSLHGRTRQVFFRVKDATGIIKNSPVKMAGIPVGVIKEIRLEDGMARIAISVRRDIPVRESSRVELRASGILGDRYIELISDNSESPELNDGGEITNVKSLGSLDEVMGEVAKVSKNLGEVTEALREATTSGNTTTPLGRIIGNIETVTADLKEFTQVNKSKIGNIVTNLERTTETLDEVINDPTEDGFRAAWGKAVSSLNRVDRTMQNIQEISEKVNNGKGTLGQLVNDDQTINEINTAVSGVNEIIGSATKIQTNLDFHSEYLANPGLYKTYLGIRIQPGLDRYYELQVIDDPKGVIETTKTETSVAGSSQPVVEERKTFKNRVKFTALFAKNFYDFTVKGGLIENSGGMGLDYYFLRRKFRLSTELFDVREKDGVRLRTSLKYSVLRGVYLVGGADDYLRKDSTSYVGAGLDLTNDDLKALLGKVSF